MVGHANATTHSCTTSESDHMSSANDQVNGLHLLPAAMRFISEGPESNCSNFLWLDVAIQWNALIFERASKLVARAKHAPT
jgi:hypothetical protein